MALIAAMVFLAYSPTLLNGFVYDDNVVILKSEWIQDASNLTKIFVSSAWGETNHSEDGSLSFYRPVMTSLFMLGYHISGLKAWGYHLINIITHTLSALLVFLIAEGLLTRRKNSDDAVATGNVTKDDGKNTMIAATGAALLFGLHPIGVEAVAWVSAISELSFTFFFLLSFYLYTRSKRLASPLAILSLFAFFLSTLCKETALMLPAVIIAYDLFPGRDEAEAKPLRERIGTYIAYVAVSVFYLLIRANALKGLPASIPAYGEVSTLKFLINLPVLTGKYLLMLALPVKLSIFHSFEIINSVVNGRFAVAILFFAALALLLVYLYKKKSALLFLIAFMTLPLVPALYFPMLGLHFFAERYLYLPSVAFAVLLSIFIMKSSNYFAYTGKVRTRAFILISLITVAIYAQGTVRHSLVWHDDLSLWSDAVSKYPESSYSHYNVGAALYNLGKKDEALNSYKTALEYNYYNRNLHYDIALIYIEKRHFKNAINHLLAAINGGLDRDPHLYINLGNAYAGVLNYGKAEESYLKALGINPASALASKNLSIVRERKRIAVEG